MHVGTAAAGLGERYWQRRRVTRGDGDRGCDGGRERRIIGLLDTDDVGARTHERDFVTAVRVAATRHRYIPRRLCGFRVAREYGHVGVRDGLALTRVAACDRAFE